MAYDQDHQTGKAFSMIGGLPSASEEYEEIVRLRSANEKLRDIIRRRLACDGSDGTWDASLNRDLTAEMRAATAPSNPYDPIDPAYTEPDVRDVV